MIPTKVHGAIDYLVGLLMLAAPWIFDFADNAVATGMFIILAAGALLYSVFTDYELGVVKRIPMPLHLLLDAGSGILLAASPWLLGFADDVWIPHVAFGAFEIAAALLTRRTPAYRGPNVVRRY